jgi:hypothetical protein
VPYRRLQVRAAGKVTAEPTGASFSVLLHWRSAPVGSAPIAKSLWPSMRCAPLPGDVFDAVDFLLTDSNHKAELRANPTYTTAARCFIEAIEDQKRKYSENKGRGPEQR